MDFINNRKRRNCGNTESMLASPILVPNIMPSKQSRYSNIHTLCSDPKLSTSPRHTATQIENKESNLSNSLTVINYNRFISIAKANEKSDLSLSISPTEWATLREHLLNSESEERFPQYNYNSKTALVTIRMSPPGPLHEKVVEQCWLGAIELRYALPKEHRSRISVQPSTIFKGFNGAYSGSRKTPDVVIRAKDNNSNKMVPRVIFEIGTSESYNHLKRNASLWLEGMPGVRECILIKIYETPQYRSPSVDNIDFPAPNQIDESAFKSEGEFGPVVYKDLHWTGKISTAFFETWTLDPLTRLATKSGERTDILLDKSNQGITLKLSTLFDVAPDKEIQSFISVEAIRQSISESLIPLGHSRCFDKVEKHLKNKQENPDFNDDTTSSNVVFDTSRSGLSIMNSQPSLCTRLNKGTRCGTKHQAFGPKRHFSLSRDKTHRDVLCLGYLGLHLWRTIHQLSQEDAHQVFPSGGFSALHQIRIPSSHRSIDQRSGPQLVKRTPHWTVPGYALGYNVRLTDQAIKKVVLICPPRNPVRLLGVLSMVVSFGNLGGCVL